MEMNSCFKERIINLQKQDNGYQKGTRLMLSKNTSIKIVQLTKRNVEKSMCTEVTRSTMQADTKIYSFHQKIGG